MCMVASQTVSHPGRRVWGHRRSPSLPGACGAHLEDLRARSTPSLVTRAALVATGTTAVALLTLLPAAPPATPSTAAVAPVGESAPALRRARTASPTTSSWPA